MSNTSISYKLLADKVSEQLPSQSQTPDSASSDETVSSLESRLIKLRTLYEKELITEDEFSTKKQELLETL